MKRFSFFISLTLLFAACAASTHPPTVTGASGGLAAGPVGIFASSLVQFDQCDALRDYYVQAALEQVGPYGLGDGTVYYSFEDVVLENAATVDSAVASDGAVSHLRTAGVDYSTTNVQEAGVDEPDSVKTDGNFIYSLLQGALQVIDVRGDSPAEVAHLTFDDMGVHGMLMVGDRLLVSGSSWGDGWHYSEVYKMVVVDISDPTDPSIVQTMEVDGTGVSSRLIDKTVHIVLRSGLVGFDWAQPEGSGLRAEGESVAKNREIIKNSTWENWLPYYILKDHRTGQSDKGTLLDCSGVYAPPSYSGLATLSVLSIDLVDGDLGDLKATGVVAEGEVVYSSLDSLYVATQPWMNFNRIVSGDDQLDSNFRTQIHQFGFEGDHANYVASGEVAGFINGQWGMSEFEGALRVVSTNSFGGWWDGDSVSQVTVLRPTGGELKQIGQVGGLGKTEQVRSVRFIGETGYVVTFRKTDPLYVIDLSDPTDPVVAGELKILGYSAYLHPVGDGLLLGIGQDATDAGLTIGTQVSLFDVSDSSDPRKIDGITFENSYSQAEWDHRSFLYWDAASLMLAPFSTWSHDDLEFSETFDTGVLAVVVTDGSVSLGATLRNGLDGPYTWDYSEEGGEDVEFVDPWSSTVQRMVVVGDKIFTLGHGGIGVHDLESLKTIEYVKWEGG